MKKNPYAALGEPPQTPPTHWRSLEHQQGEASVAANLEVEFPSGITLPGAVNRRDALKLAGASLALGALAGCDRLPMRRPEEEILPFVRMPEKVIPGVRLQYATAMQRSEGALGLLVEAHEGRPTKIEGNPNHPSSLGASDIWAQAEVLKLYDPERARVPRQQGQPSTWAQWDAYAATIQGKGLALLVEEDLGPTAERLLAALSAKRPEAKIYRWDPLSPDRALTAAELTFAPGARAHHDLEKVKVVFALDSDFLNSGPDHLRLARQWGASRAVRSAQDVSKMKRLYASEAVFSTTGSNADHRLRLASGQQLDLLKALAKELAQKHGLDLSGVSAGLEGGHALPADALKFVTALAKDLASHRAEALIIAGERQGVAAHALAYAINVALGSLGLTVSSGAPRVSMEDSLAALVKALNAGEVETLFLLDTNPVYTAPGTLHFAEALAKAKTVVQAGVLPDETSEKATWHLPLAHFLEAWGDARGWDGTASIAQPLILPLFGARASVSLLAQLAQEPELGDKKLVEATWRGKGLSLADEKVWRKALHDGVIPSSTRAPAAATVRADAVVASLSAAKSTIPSKDSLELIAVPGHARDGRLANVSWLMELPDSMSKLVWDNAVLLSPTLARELGIESAVHKNKYKSDVVEVSVDGRKITAPSFVLPGLANTSLVITQGFGRALGEVAGNVGVNVNPLLGAGTVLQGVKLSKTSTTTDLCSTQDHFSVPGNPFKEMTFAESVGEPLGAKERRLGLGDRPLFRTGTAAEFIKDPEKLAHTGDVGEEEREPGTPKSNPARLVQSTDEIRYEGQQWGMVIDLSSCTGCNVCTVACVAENNIPVVGREQVMLGREMHWIRIDRYFTGDVESPRAVHQPVACFHCENAPCEPVCPVSATTHDEEGLNTMAYNRCIGTRYCNNNCPFKVRRYNYLDFTHTGNVYVDPHWKERMKTLKLQRNPDVTVRYRGVMEKCTFCTQRVEEAKIAAKRAGHDRKALPDGAVTPACAQACPTQAITFGNINDAQSKVAQLKVSERNYEMLQELNIRPRTTYLARVRNENEELG